MMRTRMSGTPAGPNGSTIVTGLIGQFCAPAGTPEAAVTSKTAASALIPRIHFSAFNSYRKETLPSAPFFRYQPASQRAWRENRYMLRPGRPFVLALRGPS
jgi:hypothetical protein